jgi:hypothetical protein
MRFTETIFLIRARIPFIILCGILIISSSTYGQEPPPRPITVTVTKGLSFGAFSYASTTGTVTINADGSRSATGLLLFNLGYTYSTALYQIVGNPGTVINLLSSSPVNLIGSNGGLMVLTIGASNPSIPFVITTVPPASTPFYLGGTLSVGNQAANPPGNYSGTFDITFIQE